MDKEESIELIKNFINWKENLKSEKRGGILMYDIKGHYKWLYEFEIADYFFKNCK